MNLIHSICRLSAFSGKWLPGRCIQTSGTASIDEKIILEPLTEREVIQVKGDEVAQFLQGLITNDIKHLNPSTNKAIYAMFLNKAGRILYDSILYSSSESTKIFIECDKNVVNELQRHLRLFRVRRKIDIDSLSQEFTVWQGFKYNKQAQNIMDTITKEDTIDLVLSADPRLKMLGVRFLAKRDITFAELSKLFNQETVVPASDDSNFRLHRYSLGIGEGINDIPPGKCFPLEANCDILNGVSFHKGCYIGQELTARVHHTGAIRKRFMPVQVTAPLPTGSTYVVHNESGANCGIIYGSLADRALGLLRVENVFKAKKLMVNGSACFTERPQWWPQELHANFLKDLQNNI